jgi:hypothetical protein
MAASSFSTFDAHIEAFEDIFDFPAGIGFDLFGGSSLTATVRIDVSAQYAHGATTSTVTSIRQS